jgi:hypothetical protein
VPAGQLLAIAQRALPDLKEHLTMIIGIDNKMKDGQ